MQGIVDRLIGIRRCCGMEINVEKNKVMRISRKPSPLDYVRSETAGKRRMFQIFGWHDNVWRKNSIQDCHGKISVLQEEKKDSFHQQFGLKFKEEGSEVLHLEQSFLSC